MKKYKTKIKPCPFCKKIHQVFSYANVIDYDSDGYPISGESKEYVWMQDDSQEERGFMISPEHYNNRPIEDEMQSTIDELINYINELYEYLERICDMEDVLIDKKFSKIYEKYKNKE